MKLIGRGRAHGSNPFAALRVQRERVEIPLCQFRWTVVKDVDPTEVHCCGRVYGHRASHVCGCGKTKHTKKGGK